MQLKERTLNRPFTLILIGLILLSAGCQHITKTQGINEPATDGQTVPADQTAHSKPTEPHPLNGKIIAIATGEPVSQAELIETLRHRRLVLVGEKHDNPEHHARELLLLQALQNGPKTRLVLEMLDEQQSGNINTLSSASSDTEIRKQLNWNDRNWPWQDYGPLISTALKNGNQLRTGNLSKPVLMQIYQSGVPDQPRLSTVSEIPEAIRTTIRQQVYESHCRTMPIDQMGPMTDIQISRDASMAYALTHQLGEQMQSILITGAFHARKDTGVAQHLQKLTSEAVTSILLTETDEAIKTVGDAVKLNTGVTDYVWFTSRSEEKDYCAALQQQPHKKDR